MKIDKKIYKKLLQVPLGKITTYGELSRAIGLKNGQRVIGQIMKKTKGKANPKMASELLESALEARR